MTPIGAAIQTHHTVATDHSVKVSATHAAMRQKDRREESYESLIRNNGMKAANNDNPDTRSHGITSSRTLHKTSNSFFLITENSIKNAGGFGFSPALTPAIHAKIFTIHENPALRRVSIRT